MSAITSTCTDTVTTVGRYDTVEAAPLATDEVWAAR
jgi:hypothetical protein